MALFCIMRHGAVKPEYHDKNAGDVTPARPWTTIPGWGESAAGHGGEADP